MKGKILIILGILIVLGSFLAYFLLEAAVVRERNLDPVGVLAAKTDIPEGTVVRSIEQAQSLFRVIEINREHVVPMAVQLTEQGNELVPEGLLNEIMSVLFPAERRLAANDIEDLVNKRLTRSYRENEQILTTYLSDEFLDLDKPTRLFAIPVTFIDSVAAEIFPGAFVDIWVRYNEPAGIGGITEKILGPYKVVSLKTNEGVALTRETPGVPDAVILRMTEEEITKAVDMMSFGTLFFTKHER